MDTGGRGMAARWEEPIGLNVRQAYPGDRAVSNAQGEYIITGIALAVSSLSCPGVCGGNRDGTRLLQYALNTSRLAQCARRFRSRYHKAVLLALSLSAVGR